MHIKILQAVIIFLLAEGVTPAIARQGGEKYEFTTAFAETPVGRRDEFSKPDVYVVIARVDRELQALVSKTESLAKRIVGKRSMSLVISRLNYLQERENAIAEFPLSEDEIQELARLRDARKAHQESEVSRARKQRRERREAIKRGEIPDPVEPIAKFPEYRRLADLAFREPLGQAESNALDRGQKLVATWRDLNRRLKVTVRSGSYGPHSLNVFKGDMLRVVFWDDDIFKDDQCFSTVVTLDSATLDQRYVEIRSGSSDGPVHMILSFKPVR